VERIYTYPKLVPVKLIKRYQRFLVDVETPDGQTVTAFCPNSGSMKGLIDPSTPGMLSESVTLHRKTRYTLEMLSPGNHWVGINTLLTNRLAEVIIHEGLLGTLIPDIQEISREVRVGNSRLDFLLAGRRTGIYVEVKSVTLREGEKAMFPDAVTLRGRKHLETLISLKHKGFGAMMLFVVQRGDCNCFEPAADIDPGYGAALSKAIGEGIEVIVARLNVAPEGITFSGIMPLCSGH